MEPGRAVDDDEYNSIDARGIAPDAKTTVGESHHHQLDRGEAADQ